MCTDDPDGGTGVLRGRRAAVPPGGGSGLAAGLHHRRRHDRAAGRGRAGAGAVAGGPGPFGAGRRRVPGADRTPAALLRRTGVSTRRPGSVQLIETPRGFCTMTVWGEGPSWLLPGADYVTFMSAAISPTTSRCRSRWSPTSSGCWRIRGSSGQLRGGGVAGRRRDGGSARAFRAPSRALTRKLRRQDSNLNYLNQNQRCCRLHHDGLLRLASLYAGARWRALEPRRGKHARRGRA